MRLGRDDKHISEARELFEGSDQSDFYTLIRAYQFARKSNFAVETCRRYGIHAQTARQVQQTFEQKEKALPLGDFERMVADVTKIEQALGIYDLALFTPKR